MKNKIKFIIAMVIWGSIGLFVRGTTVTSSELALARGIIGTIFMIILLKIIKLKPSLQVIKNNSLLLLFSGVAIGFNWILLFEAYKYTTVAMATISYYFAPVIVSCLTPFILKEKASIKQLICIGAAMTGLILIINGNTFGNTLSKSDFIGILYGLGAACLYASVILMNKFIKGLGGIELTIIQLFTASLALLPYVLYSTKISFFNMGFVETFNILSLGIIHTGGAYYLYFSSLKEINGQTIAILSYIDPVSAVLFSTILLNENITFIQFLGAALIIMSQLAMLYKNKRT